MVRHMTATLTPTRTLYGRQVYELHDGTESFKLDKDTQCLRCGTHIQYEVLYNPNLCRSCAHMMDARLHPTNEVA